MSTATSAPAWARCRECGLGFTIAPTAKFTTTPTRCHGCRTARRARLVRVPATVDSHLFAIAADGRQFYIPAWTARTLHPGQPIVVVYDPSAPVKPGRRPVAIGVEPQEVPKDAGERHVD